MKFGKYVDEQARPDWRDKYLDYSQLKRHIKDAAAQLETGSDEAAFSPRTTSLSVAKKANESPETIFYSLLEEEVVTQLYFLQLMAFSWSWSQQNLGCRSRRSPSLLRNLSKLCANRQRLFKSRLTTARTEKTMMPSCRLVAAFFNTGKCAHFIHAHVCDVQEAQALGDEFLSLEKYVNLNYLVSASTQYAVQLVVCFAMCLTPMQHPFLVGSQRGTVYLSWKTISKNAYHCA